MIERMLGNFWVTVIAFVVGPAILVWMQVRRRRLERPAKQGSRAATGADADAAAGRRRLWPGFRGIRWGDPPAPGMTPIHEEGDTRFLARAGDELKMGHVLVTSIVYSFRIGRLESVVIELPVQGFEALARQLASEFGPPRTAPDRSTHSWLDPGTGPDASQCVLEKRAETRTARLVLSSRAALAARGAKPSGA